MTLIHAGATLAATLLFVFAFVRERPLRLRERLDPRTIVSIAGGAAVAYVFVGLSPELQSAGVAFRESTSHLGLRFLRYGVNVATMLGFLFFYGVDQLVMRELEVEAPSRDAGAGLAPRLFSVHIGSFAAYAWVVSYLMVSSEHHVTARFVFFALAMAFHFVSVSNTMRDEHGSLYQRQGAWTLAGASIAGWVCGLAFSLPDTVTGVLLGLVAGGVMANTVISELPRQRRGRLVPFVLGAVIYACFLLLA